MGAFVSHYYKARYPTPKGWTYLKTWRAEEAERLGLTIWAVASRMRRAGGRYPGLKIKRITHKVVFVKELNEK